MPQALAVRGFPVAAAFVLGLFNTGCTTGSGVRPGNPTDSIRTSGHSPVSGKLDEAARSPVDHIIYQEAKYTRLTGSNITRALFNRQLRYVPGSPLSIRYLTETFYQNELYMMTAQEAPFIPGRWKVVGDTVCVEEPDNPKPLCRILYYNADIMQVILIESSGDRRHYALGTIPR